ncbi:unnamed protein product [Blepharisma stoltei]|uniref:Uncharacterized protein n=1 Tax=Blepharisma stoltei TaxID=1481888 RepID=A0AAU9JNM8_9CILI|nr:unnamed protein product [Blepharisma stoltei]
MKQPDTKHAPAPGRKLSKRKSIKRTQLTLSMKSRPNPKSGAQNQHTIFPPKAPHNTTQFIIEQHQAAEYDPSDLLGSMLNLKSLEL